MSDDLDSDVRKPTLQDVIARAVAAFGRRLPKALPAKVVRVDASKRAVDCKILVMRPYLDEEQERQVESIPVIPSVPLVLPPFFAPPISDGSLTFGGSTLAATTGFLLWCDRSIDKWLTGGGQEVDPEFDHDHALVDACFLPGAFAFGAVPFALPQSAILIGDDTGAPAAARAGDPVQITSSSLGGALAIWMSQVETAINGIAPGSVAPLASSFLSNPGITIKSGSSKVKIG